jgi:hypothetical protein
MEASKKAMLQPRAGAHEALAGRCMFAPARIGLIFALDIAVSISLCGTIFPRAARLEKSAARRPMNKLMIAH